MTRRFEGDRFCARNVAVRSLIGRAPHRERPVHYLDVYPPTLLRADMHPGTRTGAGTSDCLHYCLPGPTLLWAELLVREAVCWFARRGGRPDTSKTSRSEV